MGQEWLKYLNFPEFGQIKYKKSTLLLEDLQPNCRMGEGVKTLEFCSVLFNEETFLPGGAVDRMTTSKGEDCFWPV